MAKILRAAHAVFGINAGGSEMGVFGSLTTSPTYSNVIATIQSLPNWGSGWAAATIATNRPALEDMNAYCYVHSYQVGYILQMGIPEWDATTTYYKNSYCQVAGVPYYSLQDTNLNKSPASEAAYWTAGIKGLSVIPSGVIVMWSGSIATIPTGWLLCDGTNGTPNLRDKFIVGAGSAYAVAATGGEATHQLTVAEMPSHTHPITSTGNNDGGTQYPQSSVNISSMNTQYTDARGGDAAHNNLPPYYALAYIMKS